MNDLKNIIVELNEDLSDPEIGEIICKILDLKNVKSCCTLNHFIALKEVIESIDKFINAKKMKND